MTFTILVIDDEDLTRKLLYHCLTRAGYEVIEAENGVEALTKLETIQPDCIISDVLMPGMNGFETLQHIREIPKLASTPVIFLSSRADTDAEYRGLETGAQKYLFKPFNVSGLLETVEMLLPVC
ncbi:MAG: response regulator [Anaerolineae bacterium]|nr:response regulator [Anaerolineae bacterium]